MSDDTKLARYLNKIWIDWDRRNGRHSILSEFAKFLKISPPELRNLLSGRRLLSDRLANRIFDAIGDEEIFNPEYHSPGKEVSGLTRYYNPVTKRYEKV